jgi:phage tail-like protein
MARGIQTDPFQNFRFHLIDLAAVDAGSKPFFDKAAGFMSVNLPNITLDPAEYKTGIMKFKQKFPGPPTVADVSLTQGIFRGESPLYQWVLDIINGGVSYRRDLALYHYHIQDSPTDQPARIIRLMNCWPTDLKPNPDYEASSSDVSVLEMTLACEQFTIIRGNQKVLSGGHDKAP